MPTGCSQYGPSLFQKPHHCGAIHCTTGSVTSRAEIPAYSCESGSRLS